MATNESWVPTINCCALFYPPPLIASITSLEVVRSAHSIPSHASYPRSTSSVHEADDANHHNRD
ncbi:hypothetical protein CPB83DRAFT_846117 [Crepidotus variabilis]|uniref:Uncharacterized protein n=1 Tax=Crepidotus variabilis TaxID=179855 RepID=A0A9P6ERA6_9AGAR|nr:hypothetical protein CPB83DRAFT_846117 [Crepidotus variabilis]